MRKPSKKSNILAALVWILSLGLAFRISPSSGFIWVPDALLLFGFYPLLISIKSPWLWLGFGLLDFFAGCMLLIVSYFPKAEFVQYEQLFHVNLVEFNAHLQSYHPYYTWALIGILSALIGLVLLIIRLCVWLFRVLAKPKQLQ